ncbi:hypothetical protein F5141DRAFT_1187326 [Pisolithus sp. B1]|nr:hypothetical protein F5141DRAFT_1187326 [Pisolithus sp. B1]
MPVSNIESEQLKQEWSSPIYACFTHEPTIEYVAGQCLHVFWCMAKGCKKGVWQFLDKSDAQSTRNMCKHVKGCWGEDIFHQATQTKNATVAHEAVKNGSIQVALDCKGKVGYSHRQHTKLETSPDTVAHDILSVFAHMWQQLATKLQSYGGKLSFGTDTWTSPNHKVFTAITVHLIEKGKPLGMPLDFSEVMRLHTGSVLANEFTNVLEDFGITDQVRCH